MNCGETEADDDNFDGLYSAFVPGAANAAMKAARAVLVGAMAIALNFLQPYYEFNSFALAFVVFGMALIRETYRFSIALLMFLTLLMLLPRGIVQAVGATMSFANCATSCLSAW
jgi:hypothetical protein